MAASSYFRRAVHRKHLVVLIMAGPILARVLNQGEELRVTPGDQMAAQAAEWTAGMQEVPPVVLIV